MKGYLPVTLRRIAPLLLPLALIAGCSSDEPEAPPADANLVEGVIVENALDAPLVDASPLPTPSPTPSETPTPEPVEEDVQVQDDADATGMTARVNRDDAAADQAPAAEEVEEKK